MEDMVAGEPGNLELWCSSIKQRRRAPVDEIVRVQAAGGTRFHVPMSLRAAVRVRPKVPELKYDRIAASRGVAAVCEYG